MASSHTLINDDSAFLIYMNKIFFWKTWHHPNNMYVTPNCFRRNCSIILKKEWNKQLKFSQILTLGRSKREIKQKKKIKLKKTFLQTEPDFANLNFAERNESFYKLKFTRKSEMLWVGEKARREWRRTYRTRDDFLFSFSEISLEIFFCSKKKKIKVV